MRPCEQAPLSERLQDIETVLRRCLAAGKAPNLDTVAGLHVRIRDCRLAAERIETGAAEAAGPAAALMELEVSSAEWPQSRVRALIDHARLGEIGLRPDEAPAISEKRGELVELRCALARQQEELQAALDAGDEDAAAALVASHALGGLADMVLAGPVREPKPRGEPCAVLPFLGVRYSAHDAGSGHDGGDAA